MTMIDPDSPLINKSVKERIIANTPMTATKANIGALVPAIITILTYIIGRLTGMIALPTGDELSGAIIAVITAVVFYAAGWVAIYLPRNTPKAHPLATCAAVGMSCVVMLMLLGGCASNGQQTAAQRSASVMVVGLTVASGLVNLYAVQPACGTDAGKLVIVCSNQTVAARLASLLMLAKQAVTLFRMAADNPAATDTDIQAAENDASAKLADLTEAADNATAGIPKPH